MLKRARRILKHRVLVTCFATAMVFFSMTVLLVPTSSALPPSSSETEYYTDGTFSTQCGFRYIFCNGQQMRGGCVTTFKTVYTEPCP